MLLSPFCLAHSLFCVCVVCCFLVAIFIMTHKMSSCMYSHCWKLSLFSVVLVGFVFLFLCFLFVCFLVCSCFGFWFGFCFDGTACWTVYWSTASTFVAINKLTALQVNTIHRLINTSLQHAIEHVERPGGSHEGVGRKNRSSTGTAASSPSTTSRCFIPRFQKVVLNFLEPN